MSKDWLFRGETYICDLRAAGVLVRDGRLLVQRERDGCEYALPGGHVQISETTQEALVREYEEETGAKIVCGPLLWTEECFFAWNGRQTHNISFYYQIALADGADIPDTGVFVPHRDNERVVFGWLPVEEIENVTIYPAFLKEEIFHLGGAPKHFVTREQ